MKRRPEFLIAATKSGSGKTLITLGMLAALRRRGYDVQPFKCGPDFIDPSLHNRIVTRTSINLDLRMMSIKGCLASHARYGEGADVAVVEGVMGLFDGGMASSASLAKVLDIPVLLVVDVRSAAESVAAIIKGFELFDPDLRICGVICNRVGSERHEEMIRAAVEQHCTAPIVGFFPREDGFEIPSRHLGLHMGHEMDDQLLEFDALAAAIERCIDLDALLLSTQRSLPPPPFPARPANGGKRRIGIALDKAFCFYYQENFDILREAGFEPVFFSPLVDRAIPDGVALLYFGGGYPELYAKELSANHAMIDAIRSWAGRGGVLYGECGGFMYLCREIIDDRQRHRMCDVFPVTVRMKKRLSSLGYREAALEQDWLLGQKGEVLYGHEFHYSEVVERSAGLEYLYTLNDGRKEGCLLGNAAGSYVHLHFARSVAKITALFDRVEAPR